MKIFKELKKLGYKHYTEHTVEELDNLPLESKERIMEQALVLRWFREKYDKYGVVNIDLSNNLKDKIFVYMVEDKLGYIIDRSEEYNTYEEAEQACLDKLIEICKNK